MIHPHHRERKVKRPTCAAKILNKVCEFGWDLKNSWNSWFQIDMQVSIICEALTYLNFYWKFRRQKAQISSCGIKPRKCLVSPWANPAACWLVRTESKYLRSFVWESLSSHSSLQFLTQDKSVSPHTALVSKGSIVLAHFYWSLLFLGIHWFSDSFKD